MPVKSAATSGLPAAFLEAVRGLFDMLDKDGKGWVSLEGAFYLL